MKEGGDVPWLPRSSDLTLFHSLTTCLYAKSCNLIDLIVEHDHLRISVQNVWTVQPAFNYSKTQICRVNDKETIDTG